MTVDYGKTRAKERGRRLEVKKNRFSFQPPTFDPLSFPIDETLFFSILASLSGQTLFFATC
jgi:hypothetical protein